MGVNFRKIRNMSPDHRDRMMRNTMRLHRHLALIGAVGLMVCSLVGIGLLAHFAWVIS